MINRKFRKSKSVGILKSNENLINSNKKYLIKSLLSDNNYENNSKKIRIRSFRFNSDKLLNYNNLEPKVKLPKIYSFNKKISKLKKKVLRKNLSFFITVQNGIRVNKGDNKIRNFRKKIKQKNKSHIKDYLDYKVFNEKDLEIEDIIDEFNTQIEKQKINKMKRKRIILNKLYGITPEYNNIIKKSKSQKFLPLEEYQDNLLEAMNYNGIHNSEILSELYQKFKIIKTDIESVIPYPKINIKNIINHFKKGIKKKNDKMLRLKEYLSKSKEPKDEFEREEQNILSLKLKKHHNYISKVQHDNLYMLPPHIKKLFIK